MAITPLYKQLIRDGEMLYIFPGASEDLSTAGYNDNLKLRFSKAVYLNLPAEKLEEGIWDATKNFYIPTDKSTYFTESYADQLIDGLRSYVANSEETIMDSMDSEGNYTYDPARVRTITERVFWKWLNRNNVLQLETAIPGQDYIATDPSLQNKNSSAVDYFPYRQWKERYVAPLDILSIVLVDNIGTQTTTVPCDNCPPSGSGGSGNSNTTTLTNYAEYLIQINLVSDSNLRVDDYILINGVSNLIIPNYFRILTKISRSQFIVGIPREAVNAEVGTDPTPESWSDKVTGVAWQVLLKYSKVVVNISEIQSVNPVQVGASSWTEVTTYLPSTVGQTPLVLWNTLCDVNYQPGYVWPNSSQQQEPIKGAESPESPININPADYPGSKWGIFDKDLADTIGEGTEGGYIYIASSGDKLRRTGDYYGTYALKNTDSDLDLFDPSRIDGLSINLNLNIYSDVANSSSNPIRTWQDYSSQIINGAKPKNFEFNAIVWMYELEYNDGATVEKANNIFGITILGHPADNPHPNLVNIKVPTIKKIVADGERTGNSHVFTLNNYLNLADSVPVIIRNNLPTNDAFGFDLFSKAMNQLSNTDAQFQLALAQFNQLTITVNSIAQSQWSQPQLDSINTRIATMQRLLQLYSTMQFKDSDTIRQQTVMSNGLTYTSFQNVAPEYANIYQYKSSRYLSSAGGVATTIPVSVLLPEGRNIFLDWVNDDDRIGLTRDGLRPFSVQFIGNWKTGQMVRIDLTSLSNARYDQGITFSYITGNTNIKLNTLNFSLPIQTTPLGVRSYLQKWGIMSSKSIYSIGNVISGNRILTIDPNYTSGLIQGDRIIIRNVTRGGINVPYITYDVISSSIGSITIKEPGGSTALPLVANGSTTIEIPSRISIEITRLYINNNSNDFRLDLKYS